MGLFSSIGGAIGAAVGLPFVGSTALSLGSGAMDYFSADQQNRQAMQNAQDQRAFSAEQVKEQEAYQTQMSNTAHQREVADLKAAGLNPLLSANTGASTPTGGAATTSPAPVVPELGPAVSSAKDSIRMLQDLRESNSRIYNNLNQNDVLRSTAAKNYSQTNVLDQDRQLLEKQNSLLEPETSVVSQHPYAFGWMKALRDRGVGGSSALDLLGSLGE